MDVRRDKALLRLPPFGSHRLMPQNDAAIDDQARAGTSYSRATSSILVMNLEVLS